MIYEKIQIRIT